jgi:hypothetical protein
MIETTILIGLVVGLTEVIKRTFALNSRFVPITAILVAIGLAFLFKGELDIPSVIYTGIIAGLTSVGLYGGTKSTIKK